MEALVKEESNETASESDSDSCDEEKFVNENVSEKLVTYVATSWITKRNALNQTKQPNQVELNQILFLAGSPWYISNGGLDIYSWSQNMQFQNMFRA